MSAIFLLPIFWPTDLESIPHASTPTLIIFAKIEVDMTSHCRVTAFLSLDTSRDLVTLKFDLLTLSSCHTWRVTWPNLSPSLKTLRLFVQELRVIAVRFDYHRKSVRDHCACVISRLSAQSDSATFLGSWERLQPRRTHRCWRKIRQTTLFRAKKCLLGSRNQCLRFKV